MAADSALAMVSEEAALAKREALGYTGSKETAAAPGGVDAAAAPKAPKAPKTTKGGDAGGEQGAGSRKRAPKKRR